MKEYKGFFLVRKTIKGIDWKAIGRWKTNLNVLGYRLSAWSSGQLVIRDPNNSKKL